jgi:hypothetical protein
MNKRKQKMTRCATSIGAHVESYLRRDIRRYHATIEFRAVSGLNLTFGINKMKCLLASILMLVALPPLAASTVLGVLEEPQCKQETLLAVRALFTNLAGTWRALSTEGGTLPAVAMWVVAFDGRTLGSLNTVDPNPETSPVGSFAKRDRLLALAPNQLPPMIPNKREQFAGWCQVPRNRPLVVLSQDHTADPDHWRRASVSRATIRRLVPEFRKQAGAALNCPKDAEIGVAFRYTERDFDVPVAYVDRKGRQLVSLRLKGELNTCDGPADIAWMNHVFMLRPSVDYIGPNLSLIDAGDYDGDGKSDVLFWFTAYNRDGYSLLSDDLQQRADYFWHYH